MKKSFLKAKQLIEWKCIRVFWHYNNVSASYHSEDREYLLEFQLRY